MSRSLTQTHILTEIVEHKFTLHAVNNKNVHLHCTFTANAKRITQIQSTLNNKHGKYNNIDWIFW